MCLSEGCGFLALFQRLSGSNAAYMGMRETSDPESDWMSVAQFAEGIGMSREFATAEIERQAVKAYRFGRVRRIRREDFDAYIAAHLIEAS